MLYVFSGCTKIYLCSFTDFTEENTGIELVRQMYKLIFKTWIVYDHLSEIGIMT